MAAFHPFFVHFPIALLAVAAGFDLFAALRASVSARSAAYILQIIAALSAILAGFSGNLAEAGIKHEQLLSSALATPLNNHTTWGNILVWIILAFVLARSFALLEKKNWARNGWLFPVASLVLSGLVIYTGLLGGRLSAAILNYFILN